MEGTITPKITIIVFLIVLLIALAIAFFQDPSTYDKSRVHTFLTAMAGLSLLITLLFYYSVVELQQQQQQLSVIDETARISNTITTSLLDEIKEASKVIPGFTLQLLPLLPKPDPVPIDPITPITQIEKQILSYKIFSVWQDVMMSTDFLGLDPITSVTLFLQLANSSELHDQWLINRLNFNSDAQVFGDLLFAYGRPIKEENVSGYIHAATDLLKDPRYQALLVN